MFEKFAVNLTENEVQMIDNRIRVPAGGWSGITKKELEHEDVIYAVRKGWIKLEKTEPTTPATPEKEPLKTISGDDPSYSGEKKPKVKVTKLGA